MRRLGLRTLLVLMAALLLVQGTQLAMALWQLQASAFLVSPFLLGALLFKGTLLLINLGVVALLWRLSGFGGRPRLIECPPSTALPQHGTRHD